MAELTRQPVDRYGVDAAIFFSDIMVPAAAVGFGVDITPGTGPVVAEPIRSRTDLARLRPLDPEHDTPYVIEAVAALVDQLDVPLIGFAGGPFTVASYLVEGGPSKDYARVKSLMLSEPAVWVDLLERLVDLALLVAALPARRGGLGGPGLRLVGGDPDPPPLRRSWCCPPPGVSSTSSAETHPSVPRVLFGVGTGELLASMATSGCTVVGLDWRVPIDEARKRIGPHLAVQGNLDPALCLTPWPIVESETRAVLDAAGTRPGYVFNLGHGVLPSTDPAVLEQIVELVHDEGRAGVSRASPS